MASGNIVLSKDQLAKIIEAYKTIQDFLSSALSADEIYSEDFLRGLKESDEDVLKKKFAEVRSFDDFVK
ncbi:MAG: hypothetical protein WAO19_00190 [Candidatus Kryptoniota bacterium]